MEENKNPQKPKWKLWIALLYMIQALTASQNYITHQELWKALDSHAYFLNQHVEISNQYLTAWNQSLREILEILNDLE